MNGAAVQNHQHEVHACFCRANSRLLEKEQSLAEEAATLAQQRESLRTLERQQDTFSNKYEEVNRQRQKAEEDLLLAQEKVRVSGFFFMR